MEKKIAQLLIWNLPNFFPFQGKKVIHSTFEPVMWGALADVMSHFYTVGLENDFMLLFWPGCGEDRCFEHKAGHWRDFGVWWWILLQTGPHISLQCFLGAKDLWATEYVLFCKSSRKIKMEKTTTKNSSAIDLKSSQFLSFTRERGQTFHIWSVMWGALAVL